MEKLGRRPLLLYPMVVMLLSFIIMMIFLNLGKKPELLVSVCLPALVRIMADVYACSLEMSLSASDTVMLVIICISLMWPNLKVLLFGLEFLYQAAEKY